jgi:hypothetical protein
MHGERPHRCPLALVHSLLRPQLLPCIEAVISAEPLDRRAHNAGAEVPNGMPVAVAKS